MKNAKREAHKLAKRLEKEKITLQNELAVIEFSDNLWLLETKNAPFYLADKCLRCGKRRAIIKQSGYCVPCHILYYKELVPCPVYAQLKKIASNGADLKEAGKCLALHSRFSFNDKFGDFLIAKNAVRCPHCNTKLYCSKCGHQIPVHLESCYRCDDKRTQQHKLTLLPITKAELNNLIKALPEGVEFSGDEFVSEALLPASSQRLEFETLLYLLENKLPNGEPVSTFFIYCAIKEALEQEPLEPYLVDFYRGSGWLPKSPTHVRIEPPFMLVDKTEIPPIVIEHEVSKFPFLGEKRDLSRMCCFNIVLSKDDDVTPLLAERFWSALFVIRYPVSFEIVGNGEEQKVVFQLICQEGDKAHIVDFINVSFPTSKLNPEGTDCDYLLEQLKPSYREKLQHGSCFGVSFGLGYHWGRLIRKYTSFSPEPLSSIVETLGTLSKDEGAIFQALIMPAKEPVAQTIESKDKLKYPLFAVSLKAMAFSDDDSDEKLKSLIASVEKSLIQYQASDGNCISQEPKELRSNLFLTTPSLAEKELVAVCERNTYRFGFIINSAELASLCHFPSKAMQHPKLLRSTMRTKEAPQIAKTGDGLAVGINEVFGTHEPVYIPEGFRFRHVYIVGKTGTGKTTLLLNMIKGDIDAGKGVGLIDPHGDLVEKVLGVIGKKRKDDVIYFDPTDTEPLSLNLLQVDNPIEKRQIRNDLATVIKRLFSGSSWSLNVDQLFRMAVATLLEDSDNTYTLPDVRKLINDEDFRNEVLCRVDDEYICEFWYSDFPAFHPASIAAVKRRLGDIINEPTVRKILSKKDTTFNFQKIMDGKQIFLANLSRGIIGEDVSSLFGGLLVSKIQLTAMARATQPDEKRTPFYLYVDEFQNFVNDSFEAILSEARKYKLCLTIAHQFTGQLPKKLYNAVFGNVGTLIVFEVGVNDAQALEKQLGLFTKDDIINLERFHTFTRIGKAIDTFSMRTLPPMKIEKTHNSQ